MLDLAAPPFADDLEPFLLLPIGAILLGLLFAGVGVRTARSSRRFARAAHRVPGVVTELRHHAAPRDPTGTYHPVLRFTTADGRLVDAESTYGRRPAGVRVGEAVTVLYDPADPTRAAVEGHAGGGLLGGCFVAFGLFFVLVGLGLGAVLAMVLRG